MQNMDDRLIKIEDNNNLLGIVIKYNFQKSGITFFTPENYSQQLAYMSRKSGYKILPHIHNKVHREVVRTQEVLFIKSGKVRVDFYNQSKIFVQSCLLEKGDVILLASGGHGFEMIEDAEIIEVKQGPYAGDSDKLRFEPQKKNLVNNVDKNARS